MHMPIPPPRHRESEPASARRLAVRRLHDLIRVMVTDGESAADLDPDAQSELPSEAVLMAMFDASRDMVREALALLSDEHLIRRRRGIGTSPVGGQHRLSAFLPPAGSDLAAHQHIGAVVPRLLHWAWTAAPAVVAARLDGVATGDDCLCVDYVLLGDGEPTCAITNYLRAAEASRITPASFDSDFFTLVDAGSATIASHDITFQASVADRQVAALLGLAPGDPVLWLEQTLRDRDGAAIDFAVAQFRPELRISFAGIPRLDLASAPRSAVPGETAGTPHPTPPERTPR